ncbi:DUF6288 domain-containing protein [Rubritalea tangerina]|uniref:DUF6288 domain-containing protein n=1 Tax=Rubritalea tangerina TaxID=430798 RepID=A0ABW4ZEY3_9BACT
MNTIFTIKAWNLSIGILAATGAVYASSFDTTQLPEFQAKTLAAEGKVELNSETAPKNKHVSPIKAKAVDLEEWYEKYPPPWSTYFHAHKLPPKVIREKVQYTFGPLGIRTLMHDQYWMRFRPVFKASVPSFLLDTEDDLSINCYEVVGTYEGSPSHETLLPGDIIYNVNGNDLITGKKYWDKNYVYKGNRGINIHMGELIDSSEATGEMTLKVIRSSEMSPEDKNAKHFVKKAEEILDQRTLKKTQQVIELPVDGKRGLLKLSFQNTTAPDKAVTYQFKRFGFYTHAGEFLSYENYVWKSGKQLETLITGSGEQEHKFTNTGSENLLIQIPANAKTFVFDLHNKTHHSRADIDFSATYSPDESIVIPKSLKKYVRNVRIKLPTLGKFSETFPDNCQKSEILAELNADFLMRNQAEDGSWSRDKSYCGRHFDTSMAALALLSMGDSKYDQAIKKAAHFIAFECTYDMWTLPKAQCLLFLAEYYLRYNDERVLLALQNIHDNLINQLVADNTAGHGGRVPAYKAKGMNLGSSNIALAFAVASKTPIQLDVEKANGVFNQLARLAPNGAVPYARASYERAIDSLSSKNTTPTRKGKNSGARTGPALLGAQIYGANQLFTTKATQHMREKLGSADAAHAVSYMSLVWSSLAMARSDKELFYENMQLFKWRFCMDRTYDNGGFIINPLDVLDHQGAERVVGLWWRTAAMVLTLNANKKNMVITGEEKYLPKQMNKVLVSDSYGYWMRKSMLDRCFAVAYQLGKKSPESLKEYTISLKNLSDDPSLGNKFDELTDKYLMQVIRDIYALPLRDEVFKASLIEVIAGIKYTVTASPNKEGSKLTWEPYNGALHKYQHLKISRPVLVIPAISGGKKLVFSNKSLEHDIKTINTEKTIPLEIKYTIGDIKMSYIRKFTLSQETLTNSITVEANIERQPSGNEIYFSLKNGHSIGAFMGNFKSCRLIMGDKQFVVNKRDFWPIITGSRCEIEYHPSAELACPSVYSIKILENKVKLADIKSITTESDRVNHSNLLEFLTDSDPDTGINIEPSKNDSDIEFLYQLRKKQKVKHINFLYDEREKNHIVKVEAFVDGKWTLVSVDAIETRKLPHSMSDRYRVTLTLKNKKKFIKGYKIKEMGLYVSPN